MNEETFLRSPQQIFPYVSLARFGSRAFFCSNPWKGNGIAVWQVKPVPEAGKGQCPLKHTVVCTCESLKNFRVLLECKREMLSGIHAAGSGVIILCTQEELSWFLWALSEVGCEKDGWCGRRSEVTALSVPCPSIHSFSQTAFIQTSKGLNFSSRLTRREKEHMQKLGIEDI